MIPALLSRSSRVAAAFIGVVVLTGVTAHPAVAQTRGPGASAPLAPELSGLGSLEYPVTTAVPEAQRFFDQGLRLLYAFNHAEALRAFREASRLDQQLAMAFWGQAMALGPNLNAPMSAANARLASDAIRRAQALSRTASDRERGLIGALAARYASTSAGNRQSLDRAYATAMAALAQRHPDDPEIQVLYADALMNTMPWDYWQRDGSFKPDAQPAVDAVERTIAGHADHPGAHHYYIHLMEGSGTPERAEPSADRLGSLMPAAGHMVHMPAHIYLRVGRYADAAEANVRAIEADEDYLAQCQAQGLYPVSYYPHNLHFLWAAATFEGRSAVAVDAARRVAEKVPHHHAGALAWTADFPVTPMLAYARFGWWKEILTEPAPPPREPYAVGIWHYARGLAFIAQDRLDRADGELANLRRIIGHDAFKTTLKDLPLLTNLQIASRVVAGELAARRGEWDTAIRSLEEAVSLEDAIPYTEPPVWHQPPRQVLGALLLEAGRPVDAERVYRADLSRFRENGWSLFGLMRSLEGQGRATDAADAKRRFERAWSRADIRLSSSRVLSAAPAGVPAAAAARSITLRNGVTLEYVERGDAAGVPVVFLHGLTDSWRSFEPVLPYLPSSIRALALTQRGHGDSSRPAGGYEVIDFAGDVALFLDALHVPSALIVGHSMGGVVAQRFAIDHPERTRGLVLVGTFPDLKTNAVVQDLWRTVETLTDPIPRSFVRDFQESTLAQPIAPALLELFVSESEKVPASVWRGSLAGLLDVELRDGLRSVRAPTLIVWGGRDAIVVRADQEQLRSSIATSRLLVYESAGHAVHWEEPARFASDLATFTLRGVGDADGTRGPVPHP